MKFKKPVVFLTTVAIATMFFALNFSIYAAEPERLNWLDVGNRTTTESGISFDLNTFIGYISNAHEGTFTFDFTLDDKFSILEGSMYRITTYGGDNSKERWRRFAQTDRITGPVTITTGPIDGELLSRAASQGQMLLVHCTLIGNHSFIVREIVITHTVNGERKIIYRLSEDNTVQNLEENAFFSKGELGLQSYESIIRIVKGDAFRTAASSSDDPAESSRPAEEIIDEADSPGLNINIKLLVLMGVVGLMILISIIMAVLVSKK